MGFVFLEPKIVSFFFLNYREQILLMETYISILWGINTSGKNKLPMTDLKAIYEKLNLGNMLTYKVVMLSFSGIQAPRIY